jgi:cytochrome c oxidase subunit 2
MRRRIVFVLVLVLAACQSAHTASPPAASAPPPLANKPPASVAAADEPPTPELGARVFEKKGCIGCHSVDGSRKVGPSLKGLLGSTVSLVDGTTVVVDEARFRARLAHQPPDKVQADYAALSEAGPNFTKVVTPREVDALVVYARTPR